MGNCGEPDSELREKFDKLMDELKEKSKVKKQLVEKLKGSVGEASASACSDGSSVCLSATQHQTALRELATARSEAEAIFNTTLHLINERWSQCGQELHEYREELLACGSGRAGLDVHSRLVFCQPDKIVEKSKEKIAADRAKGYTTLAPAGCAHGGPGEAAATCSPRRALPVTL